MTEQTAQQDRPHYVDGIGRRGTGMTSGASLDAGPRIGATHIVADRESKRTLCGRTLPKGFVYRNNPAHPGGTPERWVTCRKCRERYGL